MYNVCPPYYGLTGETAPTLPLRITTMEGSEEPVYWLSHIRVEALLPRETKYPTSGRARRRFPGFFINDGRNGAQ